MIVSLTGNCRSARQALVVGECPWAALKDRRASTIASLVAGGGFPGSRPAAMSARLHEPKRVTTNDGEGYSPPKPTRSIDRGGRPWSASHRRNPSRISSSLHCRRTNRGSRPASRSATFQPPNLAETISRSGLPSHSTDDGADPRPLAHARSCARISSSLHPRGRGRSNPAACKAAFQDPNRRVTWLRGGNRGQSRSHRGWPPWSAGRQSTIAGLAPPISPRVGLQRGFPAR